MYCKLFASLYQGTLRGRSNEILVFTNLLAHCDREGYVDKHFMAIAQEVGIDVSDVKKAIETLELPDPESRSPEHDGARLIRMDEHRAWGWRVVNYGKYRSIKDEDDRREQNRLAQAEYRAKKRDAMNSKQASAIVSNSKQASSRVSSGQQSKPESAHVDVDVEGDNINKTCASADDPNAPCKPYAPRKTEALAYSKTMQGWNHDATVAWWNHREQSRWLDSKDREIKAWKRDLETWQINNRQMFPKASKAQTAIATPRQNLPTSC